MGSFGFGAAGRPRLLAPFSPPAPDSFISPSEDWTGTAASGFSATPTDPARTTAKPAMRLLVPPNQFYTDELLVGVIAGANDGGSLYDNMGLSHVTAHYEGNSVDIAAPSFETFDDANGNPVTYFGWWVRLKHDGRLGAANLYFEAVPSDATMQHRVMGPYAFFPNDTKHDHEIEIAASKSEIVGVRYQTPRNANLWLKAQLARNPRLTITEVPALGYLDFTGMGGAGARYFGDGYLTVESTVPVIIAKPAYTNDTPALMRPSWDGIWFKGSNITFDFAAMYEIYQESEPRQHVFDGVTMTNSAGRDVLWPRGISRPVSWCVRGNPWFLEVTASNLLDLGQSASLYRGCTISDGFADAMNGTRCAIGNAWSNWNSGFFRQEIDALTVQYAGAGTGTVEISGTSGSTRTITAKVNGASVGSFTIQNSNTAFTANTNYSVQNVVDWFNNLSGWTATLNDNSRAASYLTQAGLNGFGAFGPVDAKTTPFTFVTAIDVHSDWYQEGTTTPWENVILYGNTGLDLLCQNVMIGATLTKDWLILNNAIANDPSEPDTAVFYSQFSKGHSHVVFAHNTYVAQDLGLRTDTGSTGQYAGDAYCLVANNVLRDLVWTGTPDADVMVKSNHLQADATGTDDTGETIDGDGESLFADAAAGDFAPAGALLANLKAPVVRYDLVGNLRGTTAAAGAVR